MSSEKDNDRNKIEIPVIIQIPALVLQPLSTKPKETKNVEHKTVSISKIPKISLFANKQSLPNLSLKSRDDTLSMRKPTVDGELDTLKLTDEIAAPELKLKEMNPLQMRAVDWLVANLPQSSDEATIKDTPYVLRSKITGTYSAKTPVEKNMMNENYTEQVDSIAMSKAFRDSYVYKKFMASNEGKEFKDSSEGKEHLLVIAQNDDAARHGNNVPRAKPAGTTKVTSR